MVINNVNIIPPQDDLNIKDEIANNNDNNDDIKSTMSSITNGSNLDNKEKYLSRLEPSTLEKPLTTTNLQSLQNSYNNDENLRASFNSKIKVVDWYGNKALHNAFSGRKPVDVKEVKQLISLYPNLASSCNQDGRIPLHFALDRSRVDFDSIR
jgi:hypothetical protein